MFHIQTKNKFKPELLKCANLAARVKLVPIEVACGLHLGWHNEWKYVFCHQYFLNTISSTRYPPVSNWSNRPLISGGDSSCSWVFYSCTGPNFRWDYTTCWLGSFRCSLVLSTLQSTPAGKMQTSSFQCNLYWETAACRWSGVTAMLW